MSESEQDLNFLYAINMLFLKGYMSKINYEGKSWLYKEPLKPIGHT